MSLRPVTIEDGRVVTHRANYARVEGTPPTPTTTTTVYSSPIKCVRCGKIGGAFVQNGEVAGFACWPSCPPAPSLPSRAELFDQLQEQACEIAALSARLATAEAERAALAETLALVESEARRFATRATHVFAAEEFNRLASLAGRAPSTGGTP